MKPLLFAALCGLVGLQANAEPAISLTSQPADVGDVRMDWILQHQIRLKHLRERQPEVVLLGDSITAGWVKSPLFEAELAPLKTFNAGIGGDSTQHLLWRVQHGAVETKPKVVVLLIGINNVSNGYAPAQVVSGIRAILREIRERSPETKVVLMGLFPKGEAPGTPIRVKIREVNQALAGLAEPGRVVYLDIHDKLLGPDGHLTPETAPDGLHIGLPGYEVWGAALVPVLKTLLTPTS